MTEHQSRHGPFCDWRTNPHCLKARLILLSYRTSRWFWLGGSICKRLGLPFFAMHRVVVEWFLGVELGWRVEAGLGLRLFHGTALVIHPDVKIGSGCTLRHATTLGTKVAGGAAPRLGNNVDVGSNSVVLGGISLGDGVVVGAGSVVVRDVPPGVVVAGNPARPIDDDNYC